MTARPKHERLTLAGQFRSHRGAYVGGALLLAAYQALTYGFDRGLWWGIDAAQAGRSRLRSSGRATTWSPHMPCPTPADCALKA